jgi:hypothetical protein
MYSGHVRAMSLVLPCSLFVALNDESIPTLLNQDFPFLNRNVLEEEACPNAEPKG